MPDSTPIRGVILDAGGTLIAEESSEKRTSAPLLPGVRRVLPSLAKRYRLALLANSDTATREVVTADLARRGILKYFHAVMTSSDIGWRKPHPSAFDAAVRSLGLKREETVMVGNKLEIDVAGGKAAGLRTIHLASSPRDRSVPKSALEEPSITIHSFKELPNALRRLVDLPVPARTADVR